MVKGARCTTAPLTPKHELREAARQLHGATDRRRYEGTAVDDYLYITLTDEQDVPDALARLRVIYPQPDAAGLRQPAAPAKRRRSAPRSAPRQQTPRWNIWLPFYQLQNNQPLTAEQTAFCQELIEEIWKEGDTV